MTAGTRCTTFPDTCGGDQTMNCARSIWRLYAKAASWTGTRASRYGGYGDASASHGRSKRPALLAAESAETLVPDKEIFGGLIDWWRRASQDHRTRFAADIGATQ